MTYQVEFTKSAAKEFKKLPKNIQSKILEALHLLIKNPYTELLQIKKLKGIEDIFRVHLGDYRLVYKIQKDVLVILVIKIGHRKEVYR